MTIVDSAVYVDGKRAENPSTLAETHGTARERGGVVWIGLSRPTEKEFQAVAEEFGLHELAVEDAVVAHQRPKIERYATPSSWFSRRHATSMPPRRLISARFTSSSERTSS